MHQRRSLFVAVILALGQGLPAAAQILIHALTPTNSLVTFTDTEGPVLHGPALTGLAAGEQVLSVDYRPFTGQLYAVSRGTTGLGRLHTVDPFSGALQEVALSGATFALTGAVDMDFNPAAVGGTNALRVVTSEGQNYRLVFSGAGAAVNVDGAINGAAGGAARLVATAYTRNGAGLPGGAGAGGTAQYALDSASDLLYRVNPPNNGTLTEPKPLGLDIGDQAGFDIVTGSDRALALLQVGGITGLHEIDLGSGATRRLRELPSGLIGLAAYLPLAPLSNLVVGLTSSNTLVRLSPTGGAIQAGPRLTGLGAEESVVAIDFRPLDGRLYGLTRDAASVGRLFTLDPLEGVAVPVALSGPPLILGAQVGMDFNPAANAGTNALRVVSGDGANYRIVFGLAGGTVNLDGAVNVA
ncbi:MAG: DUF4394 domain-containing protein, partial [Verrucomicrobiales bacterium]|nr:DUF4394 domain-containing protein [Verrucomicrobiales bacterium]